MACFRPCILLQAVALALSPRLASSTPCGHDSCLVQTQPVSTAGLVMLQQGTSVQSSGQERNSVAQLFVDGRAPSATSTDIRGEEAPKTKPALVFADRQAPATTPAPAVADAKEAEKTPVDQQGYEKDWVNEWKPGPTRKPTTATTTTLKSEAPRRSSRASSIVVAMAAVGIFESHVRDTMMVAM